MWCIAAMLAVRKSQNKAKHLRKHTKYACIYIKTMKIIFFLLCLSANLHAQQSSSQAYDAMLRTMLSFSVPTITCTELQTKMKAETIVLLDAREPKEYAISHIAGAQNVGFQYFNTRNLKKVGKNASIVVYCSVGYRSEKVGEKLLKAGYKNVKNLYGSIFEWSNLGFPLVDMQDKPTDRVHAYDRIWGVWLRKGTPVY
jgi:rhodanese-related sulfurtransferase